MVYTTPTGTFVNQEGGHFKVSAYVHALNYLRAWESR